VVQVDPGEPASNPPGTKRLKLPYEESPSNFAFNFNLRRYMKEEDLRPYFQLPAVIDGMFELASKLFGIKVRTTRSCLPPHPTHFESSIIELNDVL